MLHVAPGSIVPHTHAAPTHIRLMGYGKDACDEAVITDVAEIRSWIDRWEVIWIDVDGLADTEAIRSLGEVLDLHPLALEDVLDIGQRPKVDVYDDQLYIVIRELLSSEPLHSEQFSMFVGPKYVLTFQETRGDALDPIRKRLRSGRGRLRVRAPMYLAYSLIDAVLDGYFPVLEVYGHRLEQLEFQVLDCPDPSLVRRIHRFRRDLMAVRRAVWPLRDVIHTLEQDDALVDLETRVYLRDCYDHAVRVMDLVELHREVASSLMDLYLSSINNRMNEIIKVLTIISTIFMPLSFIAGVYGMNFDTQSSGWNMPELHWPLGYPFALLLMAITAVCLVLYFVSRRWISIGGFKGRRRRRIDRESVPPA